MGGPPTPAGTLLQKSKESVMPAFVGTVSEPVSRSLAGVKKRHIRVFLAVDPGSAARDDYNYDAESSICNSLQGRRCTAAFVYIYSGH